MKTIFIYPNGKKCVRFCGSEHCSGYPHCFYCDLANSDHKIDDFMHPNDAIERLTKEIPTYDASEKLISLEPTHWGMHEV